MDMGGVGWGAGGGDAGCAVPQLESVHKEVLVAVAELQEAREPLERPVVGPGGPVGGVAPFVLILLPLATRETQTQRKYFFVDQNL